MEVINLLLYQILVYAIQGKYEEGSYKNSKIKISAPTLNEEFELTDVSYYVLDIQD